MGLLREMIGRRIAIKDGAAGTMLAPLAGGRCCDILAVENPAAVEALHESYIAAGADIITADTFCSDPLTLAVWHLEDRCEEIAAAAVGAARRAASRAGRPVVVAGSVGPTVRNISLATDLTEEELRGAYARLTGALIRAGVDAVFIESVCDARNAAIAAEECRRLSPQTDIVVTASLSKIRGHIASGQPVGRFIDDMRAYSPLAVGFNCSYGAESVADNIVLAAECGLPLAAWPSAGVPDASGRYPDSAEKFASVLAGLVRRGYIDIAGGCCGTSPEYIAALAEACRGCEPRKTAGYEQH